MQGQEKITFIVILFFFSLTLCCTLLSANEKPTSIHDSLQEYSELDHSRSLQIYLFPITLLKYIFSSLKKSVNTIIGMPFVLRRLTLAECCSWFV